MSILATSAPIREYTAARWECWRCGAVSLSGKPPASRACDSCREAESTPKGIRGVRPISSRRPGIETPCKAWMGDFTEDDQPIDASGFAVMPGERICGHRDCVSPHHVIEEEALLALPA